MKNIELFEDNNLIYNYIFSYAENLRKNSCFDLSKKYYINCLQYDKNDKKNYYGLLYASVNCPDDNIALHINNLKDFLYFQNIIAICKDKEEIIKTLGIFINYVYEYIKIQKHIDDDICIVFDNMLSYYPNENDKELCDSIEKVADILLEKKEFEKSINYYSKYLDLHIKDVVYWKRLMAFLNCSDEIELINQNVDFKESDDFKRVISLTDNIDHYFDIADNWKKEQTRKLEEQRQKEEQERINQARIVEEQRQKEEQERINQARIIEEQRQKEEQEKHNKKINVKARMLCKNIKTKIDSQFVVKTILIIAVIFFFISSFVLTIVSISMDVNYKYREASVFNYLMMVFSVLAIIPAYIGCFLSGQAYENPIKWVWIYLIIWSCVFGLTTLPWFGSDYSASMLYCMTWVINIIGIPFSYLLGRKWD